MSKYLFCLLLSMSFSMINGQNALPQVSIQESIIDLPGGLVIQYTIDDIDSDDFFVELWLSTDEGKSYFIQDFSELTGDFGNVMGNDSKALYFNNINQYDIENLRYKLVVSDNYEVNIQDVVNSVDSFAIIGFMESVEGIRHWQTGLDHLQDTRNLVLDHLSLMDTDTSIQFFENDTPFDGANLFGRKIGIMSDTDEYLVGGHYDSVEDSPGADDNATAVAGMMEIARVFENYSFDKPVRFVSWDLEEAGIVGSSYFVNNIDPSLRIQAYLNFEMIGYFSDKPNTQTLPAGFEILFPEVAATVQAEDNKGNFLTNVGNAENSFDLMNDFAKHAANYVPALRVLDVPSPGKGFAVPDLLRSDHASFWIAEMPAIMLTDASEFRNPNYHTPLDVLDSLNIEFMMNNVKATVAYLAEEAGISHSRIVDLDVSIFVNTYDAKLDQSMTLYPMPTKEKFTIEFDKRLAENLNWDLYDITGKIVKKDKLQEGNTQFIIDVGDMNVGEYLLKIIGSSGYFTRKISVVND